MAARPGLRIVILIVCVAVTCLKPPRVTLGGRRWPVEQNNTLIIQIARMRDTPPHSWSSTEVRLITESVSMSNTARESMKRVTSAY